MNFDAVSLRNGDFPQAMHRLVGVVCCRTWNVHGEPFLFQPYRHVWHLGRATFKTIKFQTNQVNVYYETLLPCFDILLSFHLFAFLLFDVISIEKYPFVFIVLSSEVRSERFSFCKPPKYQRLEKHPSKVILATYPNTQHSLASNARELWYKIKTAFQMRNCSVLQEVRPEIIYCSLIAGISS